MSTASSTPSANNIRLALRHYLREVRPDWRLALPSLLLPGLGNILAFYAPTLLIAQLLKRFQGDTPLTTGVLLPYVLGFAGIYVGGEVLWRIGIHFEIRLVARALQRLYGYAMNELLKREAGFFHDHFVGALTKKAIGYARNFEIFFDTITFSVVSQLLPLGFVIVILGRYSLWLVIALLGLIGLAVVLLIPLIRRRQHLVDVREAASNVMAGHVADVLGNMDAVQAFAHERAENRQHQRYVQDYVAKALRSWDYQNRRIDLLTTPLYVLINTVGLCLALALSRHGEFDFQAVFITFNYYAAATRMVWEFSRIYRQLESALTEAAQFTDLLTTPPAVTDPARPSRLRAAHGAIEFRHVRFSYGQNSAPLFDDLNLHIAAGEKVALVGHSGGGKTTIAKLLTRAMNLDGGAILIDGQDIVQARRGDVRRAIASVPQEPAMFHRSIADNIRYGRPRATDQAVRVAARTANADGFIEQLVDGYATPVGERGVKLSGGQRQRIAIARALIKDAPILVLDEATSALDSVSEQAIQQALWRLMDGRTAIIIAHRLSTIQRVDRIIVLDKGRIIEQGSHRQLLRAGGTYADLWRHQSGGFIED